MYVSLQLMHILPELPSLFFMPRIASGQEQCRMAVDSLQDVVNGRVPTLPNGRVKRPPALVHRP